MKLEPSKTNETGEDLISLLINKTLKKPEP